MENDLISRSTMIKRINTVLSDLVLQGKMHSCEVYDTIIAIIDVEPTIDAVEVVRCKDCKHWIIDDYWNGNPDQVRGCRFAGWMCGANGYCLYGERKTNVEVQDD